MTIGNQYTEIINQLPPALWETLQPHVEKALGDIFTATALTIIYRDKTIFEGSWGWIDPETQKLPAKPDARFDLASVSKLFTSTAFLTFVSEERIGLDDPLVSVIPEFGTSGPRPIDGGQDPFTKVPMPKQPEYEGVMVDPAEVTFRQLLAHISGLAPWRSVYLAAGPTPPPPGEHDPIDRHTRWQRGLEAIYQYPFVDLPAKEIRYSDLGLILLGESLARLYGGTLDEAVQARVLDPLGLSSVVYNPLQNGVARETIVPTEDDPWRGRRLWGEVDDENTAGLGGVSGHAGLYGMGRDVATLGQAWLTHDKRLKLSDEVIAEATREQAVNDQSRRGLGWQLQHRESSAYDQSAPAHESFSELSFGHTGFTGTSLWVDPERRLVVATMTNRVYMGRAKTGMEIFRPRMHRIISSHLKA